MLLKINSARVEKKKNLESPKSWLGVIPIVYLPAHVCVFVANLFRLFKRFSVVSGLISVLLFFSCKVVADSVKSGSMAGHEGNEIDDKCARFSSGGRERNRKREAFNSDKWTVELGSLLSFHFSPGPR
jgi:hypothetical protein